MKLKFGMKNIVKFILSVLSIWLGLFSIHLIVYESPEIEFLSTFVFMLVIYLIWICFWVWYGRSQIVPKYYKEMRAVNKFISFHELRELVKDEVFVILKLPTKIKKSLTKGNIKQYETELLVSENWICANNVMIPKKMITSIKASYSHHRNIFYCNLVNKSSYEFASIYYESDDATIYLISYFSRHFGIGDIRNTTDINEYVEKFRNQVHTKDDFLHYIQ